MFFVCRVMNGSGGRWWCPSGTSGAAEHALVYLGAEFAHLGAFVVTRSAAHQPKTVNKIWNPSTGRDLDATVGSAPASVGSIKVIET